MATPPGSLKQSLDLTGASSELPKLAPGLRLSPEPDSDNDISTSEGRYSIVAQKPGFYRIDEATNSPIVPIEKTLRSTFNIFVGENVDRKQTCGKDIDEMVIGVKDTDKEGIDNEVVSEKDMWIPYQEFRAPTNQINLETSLTTTSHRSKHARNTRLHPNSTGFTYPEPGEVFHHLVESIREYHPERYSDILKLVSSSESECLSVLSPQALNVLLSGDYSRENLLKIGSSTPTAGIYLHIIWLRADPSVFFLYVGQSIEMHTRLDKHRDPVHRAKYPSLHYFIWDRGIEDERYAVEEEFVFLLAVENVDPLLLNVFEMWCCLMLQTLTKNAISKSLPANMVAPYAGTHLNIGIPLHQVPFSVMVDYQDLSLYHNSDPTIKQYYASLRRRFYELKFSPISAIRDYYPKVIRQRVINRVQKNNRRLTDFLDGAEMLVKVPPRGNSFGHQEIHLAHFEITISRKWVHLEHDAPVQVRFELMSEDEFQRNGRNPKAYCMKATKSDPAARLAIFVEGTSINGKPFAGWLRSSGEMQVRKVNTLVDILEDGTMTKSRHLPRRWVDLKYQNDLGEIERRTFFTPDQ